MDLKKRINTSPTTLWIVCFMKDLREITFTNLGAFSGHDKNATQNYYINNNALNIQEQRLNDDRVNLLRDPEEMGRENLYMINNNDYHLLTCK